jgi:hypothetical protein
VSAEVPALAGIVRPPPPEQFRIFEDRPPSRSR